MTALKTPASLAENGGLAAVGADLPHARHVPGDYYSSQAIYDLEMQRCFLRDWLFVARQEEVERPGDYLSMRLADQPIVIARDEAGALHAFYNICVHRGAEVAKGSGNTRAFMCPYHGWSYDLTGRLTGANYMAESIGFDIAQCRMKTLPLALWEGNIFISFNHAPPPFEQVMANFSAQFGVFEMGQLRVANRIALDFNCNWKLVCENAMDFYHVGVLHVKTIGKMINWNAQNISLSTDGGYHMWYTAKASTPGGKLLLDKIPWLADKPEGFSCCGFLPPNFTVFARFDCVKPIAIRPLGVDKCQIVIYQLFPEEFFSHPGFEEARKIYYDYNIEALEEDRSMIESLQKAMALQAFDPGRMSVAEKPIHHFINGHLGRLFDRPRAEGKASPTA